MFLLNKAVGFLLNPFMIGLLLLIGAFVLQWRLIRKHDIGRSTKVSIIMVLSAFVWFWFWGCNFTIRLFGVPLEKKYSPMLAHDLSQADVIIILGGGMGEPAGKCVYPEMRLAADRVWHGARLYHAKRAPYVMTTGIGTDKSDRQLLMDLGVPESALLCESIARNTEEHVELVKNILAEKYPHTDDVFKVLLVTSAWHMRRSLLNFEHSGLEVIPAAADHECTLMTSSLRVQHFFPSADSFLLNSYIFKEHLGYWLYRLKYAFKYNKEETTKNGDKKEAEDAVGGMLP